MNDKQYHQISKLLKQVSTDNQIERLATIIGDKLDPALLEKLQGRLTHNDLDILSAIGSNEITVSEVVDQLAISQGGTSRRINHLVRQGLLIKFHKGTNRKSVYLKLTPSGVILAASHDQLHQILREEAFDAVKDFSDQEIETVIRFLEKIS